MNEFAQEIRTFIQTNATGQKPPDGYTGSTHLHYGLRVPVMHAFVREWVAAHKTLTFDEWIALLDGLYSGESLEEKIMAGLFVGRYTKHREKLPLAKLDQWLEQLEGWAEVDATCQSNFRGKEVLARWDEWAAFLRKLADDPNVNKRRASMVLLLKTLGDSDDPRVLALAFEQIEKLKSEKDKRITKAISWLLRDGIKNHREAVGQYVEANQKSLPAIAVREFRAKFTTGKKSRID